MVAPYAAIQEPQPNIGTDILIPVTNMLERVNQEIKRRTHIVRMFPNADSCLRLVRALTIEIHEDWLEANRYLNMIHLKEHRRERMRKAA